MKRLKAHIRVLLRLVRPRRRSRESSFERLFASFREVLDRNNRALEIITAMGDTLGGDYLFDIQYVQRAYAELSAAMDESLESFARLSGGRYPKLREVFSRIDAQIRRGIDGTAPASDALIVFYEEITGDHARIVGGKNSSLAEVRNAAKLNVPEAFAVTTAAFDLFMESARIFERVPLSAPVSGAALREARELILHAPLPPALSRAVEMAVGKIKSRCGARCGLAVRSSAGEEDGDFSFAGQFETVLNVPADPAAVEQAYRRVVASLFSEKAAAYQARLGFDLRHMKMAVACVAMVDAAASGVLYSSDPGGDRGAMVINAAWGLGPSVVEGSTDADFYRLRKADGPGIVETKIGAKDSLAAPLRGGGVGAVETPQEKRGKPSLTPGQAEELGRLGLALERHFNRPQDIEWAIDGAGKIFILQSRPLRMAEESVPRRRPAEAAAARVIMKQKGVAVQKGAAAGRVFIVRSDRDLDAVPRGAVLVARHDSSQFIRVMTGVSAIITATGTPTSHMAALCREFRIPTVVNAGGATAQLAAGRDVTVEVDGDGATVYEGTVREVVERAEAGSARMEDLFEFRRKRYLLRFIAPLNLIDPLRDEFTPQACRTFHDILRFIHEKSVAGLIEGAEGVKAGAVRLDLPIPAGLMVIDIGGGLDNPGERAAVAVDRITSLPLRAIIAGMTRPGAWRSEAVPLGVNDFMTSMLRVPDITTGSGGRVETNMAVVSREYANINLKFGYHFIILDCFCGEKARNNHIYFRFAGGATDMTKRSRRLQLIAAILEEYGFAVRTKGDLIVARMANMPQGDVERVLDQLGRLFSYTRQLDAVLNDDQAVERYTRAFLNGTYGQAEAGPGKERESAG